MILVTGGAGYIGCVSVTNLLEHGKNVKVYDKLYFDADGLEPLKDRIELIQGDVRSFDDAVLDGVDAVVHLGSLSNDPMADFDPKANWEINYEGSQKVAEAAKRKGIKKFILASTCAVIGFNPTETTDEEAEPNPQSEYARSKLEAEKGLLALTDDNFCPIVLRQATVFGLSPRMRWDLVVNTFTKDAFQKGQLTVRSAGEMWRPLVHVKDLAEVYNVCLDAPDEKVGGQIFNVVHSNIRILDLAQQVQEILKDIKKIEINTVPSDAKSRSYRIKGDKLQNVLGFTPGITFEEAVKEMYAVLASGEITDPSNPRYCNIEWLKLLMEMEERLGKIGKVL